MTEFRTDSQYGEWHVVGWDEPKNDKDCDHDWQRDDSVVLTTYPPKRQYVCSKCGAKKTGPAYTAPVEVDDFVEDLRLQLEESRALNGKLEAEVRLAKAKAEKWKQCALEAKDRAMGLTDELEDWKDRYDSTSAGLDAWHRKSLSLQKRFDDEEAAHERTTIQYERAMLKCAELTSEYNKLARHFVSLYNSLCVCCMNHNDSCCDCGSMERYKDIFEALEKGLNKLS